MSTLAESTDDGAPRERSVRRDLSGYSRSVDWYAEGESRMVEVNGMQIVVRLIGRKGRRARIALEAPPGATFRDVREHDA